MPEDRQSPSPAEQVTRLYEQAETQAAKAGESLVGSRGFASLLGQLAENAAAMAKLSTDAMDLVLRNLRLAGRRDVVRLARQLGRTEDKLERVLQELEELRDQLRERDEPTSARNGATAGPRRAGTRRAGSRRAGTAGGGPAGSGSASGSAGSGPAGSGSAGSGPAGEESRASS